MVPYIKVSQLHMSMIEGSDVTMTINRGEIVGITGRNGCGKSTLAGYLAGKTRPEAMGSVLINGYDTYSQLDREKVQRISGMVYQNPRESIVFDNISRDIIFGTENIGFEPQKTLKRGSFYLKKYKLKAKKNSSYQSISASEQQRAVLASVLIAHPDLLVMDEPFSMCSGEEVSKNLNSLIKNARAKGQTVIIFSKNTDVLKLTDVQYELYEGKIREVDITGLDYIYRNLKLNKLNSSTISGNLKIDKFIDGNGSKANTGLSLHNLSFGYDDKLIIDRVNSRFEAGSAYKIRGRQGAGKTTLLKLAAGMIKPYEGEVFRSDNTKVGFVFEYSDDGFVEASVLDDVMFGPMNGGYSKNKAREMAEAVLTFVGVDRSLWTRKISTLSFGEKKMVAMAGAICLNPDFLLMDNPFAGLDYDSRLHISQIIEGLCSEGKCIIITES